MLKALWRDEQGASAVEYSLIAGLVGVLLLGVLAETGVFGTAFKGMFTRLSAKMDEVAPTGTP